MKMKIHIGKSIVPNFFTVLNIFFGFISIIYAVQEQFQLAVWYIFAAALCDALDGFMARLTKSASEFGVELDSLADVVSFGVAPSFLLYKICFHQFGGLGTLVSAMPLIFGALRLARFNVQLNGFHKEHFNGLPIPLSAMTVLSFILFFGQESIKKEIPVQYALIGLTIVVSFLMITLIRYPVLPKLSRKNFLLHPVQMSLFIAAIIALIVSGLKALFPILAAIVLSGVLLAGMRLIKSLFHRLQVQDDDEEAEPQPSPINHH